MSPQRVVDYPLPVFRFRVSFSVPSVGGANRGEERALCEGAFSECSGLEATMEPKSIKEGGSNYGELHRAGRVTFSTVILKRGVTTSRDLWTWFRLVGGGAFAYRLNAEVTLLDFAPDGARNPVITWTMKNALPTKFKAADFNATATQVGIEELHFVHEGLESQPASPSS